MMTFAAFVAARLGTFDTFDRIGSAQCVDLVEDYVETVLGKMHIGGNAVDLYDNSNPRQWTRILNGPANFPFPGGVVTWVPTPSLGIGQYGHCGLALLADADHLITLDQDWPPGAPVSVVVHTYTGVHGWLQPRP